jgi:hypothetical protein
VRVYTALLFLVFLPNVILADHHLEEPIVLKSDFKEIMKPASGEELIDTALKLERESGRQMAQKKDLPCPKTSDQPQEKQKKEIEKKKSVPEKKSFICLCEVGSEEGKKKAQKEYENSYAHFLEDKGFLERYIGLNRQTDFTLRTGNDNWGHGLGRVIGLEEYDGDDRQRTFSAGVEYQLKGDEGEFSISLDTTGWGNFAPLETKLKGGGTSYEYQDEDGAYYQDFLEKDVLDVNYLGYLDGNGKGRTLRLGVRVEDFKDHGPGAQGIQEWFHGINEDYIQYNYNDWLKDHNGDEFQDRIVGYLGFGKRWEADLGKWKCSATAEVLAGVDFLDPSYIEGGGRFSAELNSGTAGGRQADNPWFAVALYDQAMANTVDDGIDNSLGIMMSTSFRAGSAIIKPFMGVEYHDATEDRFFNAGGENEIYHTVGVMVSFGGTRH